MEPEGSLTHSQPPVPILGQPNPVHIPTSHLLEIHPNIIYPSTPRFPEWSLSLRFPHQDPIHPPLLTHKRHMPCPSHSSRFYHPHNIGWGFHIIKLFVMQSPPFPRYLVPPRSKYSHQHHILKHPQLPFLPKCQRPGFTPIQNNRQNFSSIYRDLQQIILPITCVGVKTNSCLLFRNTKCECIVLVLETDQRILTSCPPPTPPTQIRMAFFTSPE